jgi:hypothetical protein
MKYAISILLALCLLLGAGLYHTVGSVSTLREQNSVLVEARKQTEEASKRASERIAADRKVLVARQAQIAAQRVLEAQTQAALSAVLQANKTWSDTDVPPEVQKALGGAPDSLDGPSDSLPNPD